MISPFDQLQTTQLAHDHYDKKKQRKERRSKAYACMRLGTPVLLSFVLFSTSDYMTYDSMEQSDWPIPQSHSLLKDDNCLWESRGFD